MKANINWHRHKLEGIKTMLNVRTDRILVYKGTMPTDANGFTKASRESDLLATYTVAANAYQIVSADYSRLYLGTIPAAVAPVQSGLATWFLCAANANDTYVFIGEVSSVQDNGILMFWDNNLVSGVSTSINSMVLTVKQA